MRLFVDDERPTPLDFNVCARTYEDAIDCLERLGDRITKVSLDHDLGEEKTGYDIACFLEERAVNKLPIPAEILCHSANPPGRARIEQVIKSIERYR